MPIGALAERLVRGERRALARAITLVESTRADHRKEAEALLAAILPQTGRSIRLGLSGAPGVGKSTFIEAFGTRLTGAGHRVAVLAIDPSSARTGGSILGDKTRMETLARDPNAFIRPSPSGGSLGGVARRTRAVILLAEAAGFDVVMVETVGVGQSEIAVADMVDMFLLLLSPGGGDELQGIKRGIMELADLVIMNKADGEMMKPAGRAAAEFRAALHLMRPKSAHWTAKVVLASARERSGLDEIWEEIGKFRTYLDRAGEIAGNRRRQALTWMWAEIEEGLIDTLRGNTRIAKLLLSLETEVAAGRLAPSSAAHQVLEAFAGATGEGTAFEG